MIDRQRPASLLLVHGAGSGPWVFDGWSETLAGIEVAAIDLQDGLAVGQASMRDYSDKLVEAASRRSEPLSLCGWAMGGLVVLQAAQELQPHSVVLIEASPPGEVRGFHRDEALEEGLFDPEEMYGSFPAGVSARPESRLARSERKRGISVAALPCPSLVVYGDEFPWERGAALAALYGSAQAQMEGLNHWELVHDPRVRERIARFLGLEARVTVEP